MRSQYSEQNEDNVCGCTQIISYCKRIPRLDVSRKWLREWCSIECWNSNKWSLAFPRNSTLFHSTLITVNWRKIPKFLCKQVPKSQDYVGLQSRLDHSWGPVLEEKVSVVSQLLPSKRARFVQWQRQVDCCRVQRKDLDYGQEFCR